jgi:hypothetical protein
MKPPSTKPKDGKPEMTEKYSYFNTTAQDRETWEKLCPPNEFRRQPPSALSGLLPGGLLAKADSVFMLASGSPQGTIVWMANVHRVDQKASGVDQEPFGIVFHGPTPALSGVLIHHGNWPGRTELPTPPEFWPAVAASGVGNCLPLAEAPSKPAGLISELNVQSQHDAFGALLQQLKGSLTSGG